MQKVNIKLVHWTLLVCLLSACSGGSNSAAVDLCKTAVQDRMTDSNAKFADDMASKAVAGADGIVVLNSSFSGERTDNGATVPYTQTFSCSVAMTDEQGNSNPRVIRMQINW